MIRLRARWLCDGERGQNEEEQEEEEEVAVGALFRTLVLSSGYVIGYHCTCLGQHEVIPVCLFVDVGV